MTADWDLFIESLDGGNREWANSLDTTALTNLQGQEREDAIQLLLARLSTGSARISRALGLLPDPRVVKALELHLPVARGADRVATASSLLQLGSPQRQQALTAIAQGLAEPDLVVASEALKAAAEQAGVAVLHPLIATAVTHPIENIRVGAIKTALFVSGVTDSPLGWTYRTEIVGLVRGTPDVQRQSFDVLCGLMKVDLTTYTGPRPR
ncbi:MAG: hypothetical protein ABW321_36010 [Polyangiales bacterium]